MDISKLAMHFSLGIEDVATTLVSTASMENLKKNVAAVSEELTDAEKNTMNYVIEKYVIRMKVKLSIFPTVLNVWILGRTL